MPSPSHHEEAPAVLVVAPQSDHERLVTIHDRLVVGRECAGVDERRRLVLEGSDVSRHHCEIRLDIEHDRASVVDLSTNGTKLNNVRVERAVAVPLRSGDRIAVGSFEMLFLSNRFAQTRPTDPRRTERKIALQELVLVVGDIVNYSSLSEHTPSEVVYRGLEQVYRPLRSLLDEHRGTFVHYQGDAFFAYWEDDSTPNAACRAVEFALAAASMVSTIAPELPISNVDGAPIEMGWAVVAGEGVVSSLTGTPITVLGDTTNVAFRLAGMAARDGRAAVVASAPVVVAAGGRCETSEPLDVEVRGRVGRETVYELHGLRPAD